MTGELLYLRTLATGTLWLMVLVLALPWWAARRSRARAAALEREAEAAGEQERMERSGRE